MGSTGYLTCGICWMCGNCYPREAACPACGAIVNLDGQACPACGRAIEEGDRLVARERFKAARKAEADRDFPQVKAAVRPTSPMSLVAPLRRA